MVTRSSIRCRVMCAISETAWSKIAWLAADGFVVPLTLRTNCRAAAATSSLVAGGSKLFSGRMLRHMPRAYVARGGLRPRRSSASPPVTSTTRPSGQRHQPDRADVVAVLDLDRPVLELPVAEREHRDQADLAALAVVADDGEDLALLGEPGELARVLGRERVAVAAVGDDVEPARVGQVGDVEQPGLRAPAPPVRGRSLAEPEQPVLAERVQVRREAGDLELRPSASARPGR